MQARRRSVPGALATPWLDCIRAAARCMHMQSERPMAHSGVFYGWGRGRWGGRAALHSRPPTLLKRALALRAAAAAAAKNFMAEVPLDHSYSHDN